MQRADRFGNQCICKPIYRLNPFIVRDGNGRARSNAYIAGGVDDVGNGYFSQEDYVCQVIIKCCKQQDKLLK